MADIIETMYCEIVFSLDRGEADFLCVRACVCVCVCVCVCGMTATHGILLCIVPVE